MYVAAWFYIDKELYGALTDEEARDLAQFMSCGLDNLEVYDDAQVSR